MSDELTPEDRERLTNAVPDPLAVLDMIERVHTAGLPGASFTIEGTWDDGAAPDAETEPE